MILITQDKFYPLLIVSEKDVKFLTIIFMEVDQEDDQKRWWKCVQAFIDRWKLKAGKSKNRGDCEKSIKEEKVL